VLPVDGTLKFIGPLNQFPFNRDFRIIQCRISQFLLYLIVILFICAAINLHKGADKSLARLDWRNNWNIAIFYPTRRSLLPRRPGWTDNILNCFWVACESQGLVAVACFLPGRAKDLSAPRYYINHCRLEERCQLQGEVLFQL